VRTEEKRAVCHPCREACRPWTTIAVDWLTYLAKALLQRSAQPLLGCDYCFDVNISHVESELGSSIVPRRIANSDAQRTAANCFLLAHFPEEMGPLPQVVVLDVQQ
jgi:hypothetical protein